MESQMIDPAQKIYVHEKTGRTVVETVNKEKSMTQQQFKDECDINNIMKRYATTGEFTHMTSKSGVYADFSEIKDYHSMLQQVMDAQDAFMALPADMRQRFSNDPGQLILFLQDSKNRDEAEKLGLIEKIKKEDMGKTIQTQTNETSQTPAT